MGSERTLINMRGYCFYCLKKISNEGDNSNCYKSPAGTPVPPSPLSTPLRTRCHNVHDLPPEERLAPFVDLCRYMEIELPDNYAFGDGSETVVMYPPLCDKCHELSARLCVLQDELQYIQTRIRNTVERIHRRVTSTCDTRGAIKRQEFNKDFRRQSKGSLSRGRSENPEMKKVNDLLKVFQMKMIEKDHEFRERKKRRATNVLFPECRNSLGPPGLPYLLNYDPNLENEENILATNLKNEENIQVINLENEENIQAIVVSESEAVEDEQLSLGTAAEYLPPEETLRCARPEINRHASNQEIENLHPRREDFKPYPDVSTIVCSYRTDDSRPTLEDGGDGTMDSIHLKTTIVVGNGVTTRSQARVQTQRNTFSRSNQQQYLVNDNSAIRRRTKMRLSKRVIQK